MFHRILVPIDGSPPAKRGLDKAIALAKDQAARICLLHVVDASIMTQTFDGTTYMPASYADDFMKSLSAEGRRLLAQAEEKVRKHRIKVETVLLDTLGYRVADVVISQAKKWHADVIVIGTHGRRGLSRLVMGSAAELVMREAPVPLLLVRGPVSRPQRRARRKS